MLPLKTAAALVTLALVAGSISTRLAQAANTPRPADPCNKGELLVDDAQGILNGKATVNHYSGEKLVVPTTGAAIAAKLGVLCDKLFAAHGGK